MTKITIGTSVLSFEEEFLRNKKKRYHWMISSTEEPDFLVSWGDAPTEEEAEAEAIKELKSLALGLTQGGRVVASSVTSRNRDRVAARINGHSPRKQTARIAPRRV